jgi:hypothetical protein
VTCWHMSREVHAAKILAIPRATPQPRRRRYSSHERSTSHCAPAASSAIEPFRVDMSEAALDVERTQGMFCSTSNPVMRPGYLKGKSSIWIARNVERKVGNFLRHKFWARGYFVSIVARNEEMIRRLYQHSGDGGQAVGSVAIEACVLMKSHLSSQNPL